MVSERLVVQNLVAIVQHRKHVVLGQTGRLLALLRIRAVSAGSSGDATPTVSGPSSPRAARWSVVNAVPRFQLSFRNNGSFEFSWGQFSG
jgi:hypothetical protein